MPTNIKTFTMKGIRNKSKRVFMTSFFSFLVMIGYVLFHKAAFPFYAPVKIAARVAGSPNEDRIIVASGNVTPKQDSAKLADDFGGDSPTKWDMFDGEHIDVALYSCNKNWAKRRIIYRTVECPGTRRTISFRRALGNVTAASSADVIIFGQGVGSLKDLKQLKELRKPHQIWLHTATESAFQAPPVAHYSTRIDAIFNMSFCYHSKAEIVAPYGAYIPRLESKADKGTKITRKPDIPILAAWASSHCDHAFWNRTGFVRDLAKYLPMDLFGGCGDSRVPRNESGSEVLKKYKFYLAFENTCCSYYITEKFWKALGDYESVPIVVGSSKSEYESVAPPNSFVYADDFASFEDLANYIKIVANDEALYNKFHEWRRYGEAKVYTNRLVYPMVEDENVCRLLDYLEKNAWRKDHPLQMKLDPFGPDWAASCISCGKRDWMKDYGLESKNFTKRLHLLQTIKV